MKKIKKVTIELSETLLDKIERAVLDDGFHSRSEFIRFLIMNYVQKNENNNFTTNREQPTIKEEEDIFANVDCEFGIPVDIIEKIAEMAKREVEEEGRLEH